jgi:hypothetical protein
MNAQLKPGVDAVAKAFLEVRLRRDNMGIDALADRCGWSRHSFMSQMTAGFPCLPLRHKIECEMGFLAIWSSGSEIHLRQQCFNSHGIDPRVAPLPDVKELCRRLGVQTPFVRRQEEWVGNLLAWLAVNPSQKNNKTKVNKI